MLEIVICLECWCQVALDDVVSELVQPSHPFTFKI